MKFLHTLSLLALPFITYCQCDENEFLISVTSTSGEWANEMSWEFWGDSTWILGLESPQEPLISFQGANDYETTLLEECIPDTGCYMLAGYDSWGDGWNDGYVTIDINNGAINETFELADGSYAYWTINLNTDSCEWEIPGCTDPTSTNYNEFATIDDGSCISPLLFEWDKQEREYFLYVPNDLPENAPLVFVLHGYGGNGEMWIEVFQELADQHKFVVCAPNGLEDNFGINHFNSNFNAAMSTVDDIGFLSNLAFYLHDEFDLNPDQTFSCGYSNGGYMSFSLACNAPEVFKAIASVTGTMSGNDWGDFNPSPLVPVMQISGTNDNIVPKVGVTEEYWDGAPDIYSIMDSWSAQHNCEATETENIMFDYPTDITYYNQCDNNAELRLYVANGMGHIWPSFAVSEIWDFFMQLESSSTSLAKPMSYNKLLVKILDVLGQEVAFKKNIPLLYLYDDGSVEKKIIIE
jgi:polyhydroxybutyrate depolymerase